MIAQMLGWIPTAAVLAGAAAIFTAGLLAGRRRSWHVPLVERADDDFSFGHLFEHAYDAILILEPDSEIVLDANHRACVLYGFTRREFIGRSMLELSVDAPRANANLRRAPERSDRYATFESQQLRSDGAVMDLEINAAKILYRGVPAILSINRDITARRRAENAIRGSEERFRLLLENITDYAIVMLDPSGRIVSWNEGAERITGYTAEEALGRSAPIFYAPGNERWFQDRLAEATRTGRVEYQATRARKCGSEVTVSVTLAPIVDQFKVLRGYAAITHDISTEIALARTREEMVTVLRNVAREWTATFDAVAAPIVLLDCDGTIRRVNRAAQLLGGQPFQSLVGKAAAEIGREPWPTIAALGAATAAQRAAGSARAVEDGLVWQVSSSLVGDGAEQEHVIVVAYDLTLVSQLEATVRHNEVAAALGSLVAGVAHEVRNPLFTISATLDAWEARYSGEEGVRRYAGLMRGQTERLGRLMRDLLDYGKPNPLQITAAPVADVIRAAAADCAVIAAERSARLELALEELPPSAIDPVRLEQVFQNVIDNAVRHSPAGGTVHVSAAMEDGWIVCRITDEGNGIGEQDPATMFQPFYTRRRGGTGLGLSIAQKFIAAHGGDARIANRGDRSGTEVLIRLPFREIELSALSGVRAG